MHRLSQVIKAPKTPKRQQKRIYTLLNLICLTIGKHFIHSPPTPPIKMQMDQPTKQTERSRNFTLPKIIGLRERQNIKISKALLSKRKLRSMLHGLHINKPPLDR